MRDWSIVRLGRGVMVSLLLTWGTAASVAAQESAQRQEDQRVPRVSVSQPENASVKPVSGPHHDEFSGITATSLLNLPRDLFEDQKEIWTSPAQLRFSDTQWLVPLAGIEAGLFATDASFSRHLSQAPYTISHYKKVSDAGVGALIGGAAGMWALGKMKHDDHWTETGFLAGEAALNSLAVVEAMKYTLWRDRPYQGDGSGRFFQGGVSFPSEHAAAAWSVAGVIAHEYPGPLSKVMVYGLASLVSFSRIRAHQHFPSDVLAGTVIGNLVTQNVYSRRHDPELGGEVWRSVSDLFRGDVNPSNQGSPYVTLDSWIYPALDRLAALGLIDSGFAGLRPWTRRECARLVAEAEEKIGTDESTGREQQASVLIESLAQEFRADNESASGGKNTSFRIESIYQRTENISGMPLTDGYHFAQTQINDFGRPFGEGWNTLTGFSAYATSGRWVTYVRGEWQTAPSIPALPLPARQTISAEDQLPLPPGISRPSIGQFELLDSYVGLALLNWQVTFGKQSLWWGPDEGGPMIFSDNAKPMNMFRVNRVTPFKLPSILGRLGPIRLEFFIGQKEGSDFLFGPSGLVGQWGLAFSPQPIVQGQKISFKPTPNLEFSVSRTVTYGGPGYPVTLHTLLRTNFSIGNTNGGNVDKPGDRRSGFDLKYRLPGLRKWVSFYADGFADDQFSPIGYPDRSVWSAGLYFVRFPRLTNLDLRVEGVYSDNPLGGTIGPGFFYNNFTWRNGYTNDGNLIGSWIGRAGQGAQAWSNYWLGARSRIQFNFRHQKVSQDFVPGGGTLTDIGVRGDYWVRSSLGLSASVQAEQWLFPVIQPNASRNATSTVEILFQPRKLFRHSATNLSGAVDCQ